MPNPTRRDLLLAAAASLALPGAAWAQTFPDRPIRLTVGFPPGSGPDVAARMIASRLSEQLKQQVVVENKPGAGGQIAAVGVARSAPDGYNLLLGEVGSIAIAPPAFSRLPYDPPKDLAGISEVVRADFLLVVAATSPHQTVADFVRAARAGKDRVNFATFGAGTPGHFGAELFGDEAGFKVEPIHYRTTGDAVTAIVSGDVAGAFVSTPLGAAQVKGGKMRALATTASARAPQLPQVPTFVEAGWPRVDFTSWFAIFAPAGTPAPVLDLLNRELAAAVQSADTRAKLQDAGFNVRGTSRDETDRMLRAEATRWAALVKASGFKGD